MLSALPIHLRRLLVGGVAVVVVGGGIAAAAEVGVFTEPEDPTLGTEEITDPSDGTDGTEATDGTDTTDGTDGTETTDGTDTPDGTDTTDGSDGAEEPVEAEAPEGEAPEEEAPEETEVVEEEPVDDAGPPEGTHGAAVSAAAQADDEVWEGLGCRNRGQYVSAVARGLDPAEVCAPPAEGETEAPADEDVEAPAEEPVEEPVEEPAEEMVEESVAAEEPAEAERGGPPAVPPGQAKRDR